MSCWAEIDDGLILFDLTALVTINQHFQAVQFPMVQSVLKDIIRVNKNEFFGTIALIAQHSLLSHEWMLG
jgi:hypothetical protein